MNSPVFGAYGEWSWDVEWLLEEAASRAVRRRHGRAWATGGPRRRARSHSPSPCCSRTLRSRRGSRVLNHDAYGSLRTRSHDLLLKWPPGHP